MALSSLPPLLSPLSSFSFKLSSHFNSFNSLFFTENVIPPLSIYPFFKHNVICNCSKQESRNAAKFKSGFLNEELLRRISIVKEADEAMAIIMEAKEGQGGGEVINEDCRSIIAAAINRGNADLALSVFHAMRSSFGEGLNENISSIKSWSWARPDASTYALLVRGLAASLRVSDAIRVLKYISGAGVSSGEEVRFGVTVPCPICTIAIAVAQPQHGIQVASCSKCRYQYQLISGEIVSIQSEVISKDNSAWEKALRFLQITKQSAPAALHSILLRTPTGTASTHKFATKTSDLPAQEGERVTVSLAAQANMYREIGPLKLSSRTPGMAPGQPMSITNHATGQVSQLLQAPMEDEGFSLFNPSMLIPALTLLAAADAASGVVDPGLPRLISVTAVGSVTLGTAINALVLPELRKLPQRRVDVVAIKQQLLSQYDLLQTRIQELRHASEKEVWMLARMCQLEKKILAVGQSSYRARRDRVIKVRESLEKSLFARIELIESYAKISSMIEIEVEMDSDVLAAEAVSNVESIAEQIQQMMEIENLEERWRIQAEANDEVERLLSSQSSFSERTAGVD